MSKYQAHVLTLSPIGEVLARIVRDLNAATLPEAKTEALAASNAAPEANLILLLENGAPLLKCRLETVVAEWSSTSREEPALTPGPDCSRT